TAGSEPVAATAELHGSPASIETPAYAAAFFKSNAAFDSSGGGEESDAFWPWLDRQPLPTSGDVEQPQAEEQDGFWLWFSDDPPNQDMWVPAKEGFAPTCGVQVPAVVHSAPPQSACQGDLKVLSTPNSAPERVVVGEKHAGRTAAGSTSLLAQIATSLFGWCALFRQRRRRDQEERGK